MRVRTVGDATIIALEDGAGPHFRARADAFPDATPQQWQRADELDPGALTSEGEWLLSFRCFAIRLGDGTVTLVDAGVGPLDSPAASWAPVPGRLPAELHAAGIDPADVGTVVLTHLHTDHIGWAVVDEPYFTNASYLIPRADHAALDELNPQLERRLIAPLRDAGQLRLVEGDVRLRANVRVVATPGHTPGHQSVLVESDEGTVAITGDLLVHAVQLVDPDLAYLYESDPALARESRRTLLAGRPTLATAHLAEPFGYR